MSDSILLEVRDGLAHVTLNRPDSLNAIDAGAAHRWRDIGAEVAGRDDVHAVLLDAKGRAFCAGGDVISMSRLEGHDTQGDAVRVLADVIHDGHRHFRGGTKPIVAVVQGAVVGGGLGFMLCADVIIAAEGASFASKYADIGLTPDCGVSTLLPEAIGTRRALELTLTPRTLNADEAREWGLVTEVLPAEAIHERARVIAAHWISGASAAFGQAKRLIIAGGTRSFREALDDEAMTIGAAFDSDEARARVAAFAARSARPAR